uniref:Sulfotransferase n=1 Tax=Pseudonaja textilis TaxID=8673 RepID=A0A670ZB03_PSETE
MESLEIKPINCSKLVDVEGIQMPIEIVEHWDLISAFQARPDDLLICTYPKAGTTWIQEIVDMVQHRGDVQKCARAPIYERSPYLELFPPEPLPSGENVKDCAVSYFYFQRMLKLFQDPGTWKDFLENFIAGEIAYGSWFDHVLGWWKAKDHHSILYLFYEDLKENPAQEIQKVAQFLNIELSASVLDQIVQHTTFESMKNNPMTNYSNIPSAFMDQNVSPFMRKGTVGNWKEHFTVAQSQQIDEIYAQKLGNTGLKFRTEL